MNICVDFGHNSVKAIANKQPIIFPSITSTEVKPIELTEFSNYQPLNYIHVKYNGSEYFIGELARKQSRLCIQNVNDDDLMSHETKLLILTAIAYLNNDDYVNLATDLPVTHLSDLKGDIKNMLKDKNYPIVIDFFDYKKQQWITKAFYINNVEVQSQGFYALMQELLDDYGNLHPDKKDMAQQLNVVVDIGYYSTDIVILDALEPIKLVPQSAIPGMVSAYKMINQSLHDTFGIRKELHEIEPYILQNKIRIGGSTYDISDLINTAYSRVTEKIVSEINNLIYFWPEVDNWFMAGGGALALGEDFKSHYQNVNITDDPQFSNAKGGLKWARRKFK